MSETRVYLAGPVQFAVDSGRNWREGVKARGDQGIEFADPLAKYDVPAGDVEIVSETPVGEGEIHVGELVSADKAMIRSADAVFVRWQAIPSCGTPMEVLYAYERDIPVGVWYDEDGDHRISPWMEHHADLIGNGPGEVIAWIQDEVQ